MRKYFTTCDIVLIISLLFVSLLGTAWAGRLYGGEKHVVVEVDGKRVLELPLDQNDVRAVKGHLGETVIHIENNGVYISESACHNKICIKMGRIHLIGEVLICIPNRIVVTIKGNGDKNTLDGVTR